MGKLSMDGFKGVEVTRGSYTIKRGGHLNKPLPLTTKDIQAATYVLLRTREPWLNQAVVGTYSRGHMHPGVLKALQQQVRIAEKRIRKGRPGTAPPQHKLKDDPMDEMGLSDKDDEPKVEKGWQGEKKESSARYA